MNIAILESEPFNANYDTAAAGTSKRKSLELSNPMPCKRRLSSKTLLNIVSPVHHATTVTHTTNATVYPTTTNLVDEFYNNPTTEADYFETQFFKQIDIEMANTSTTNTAKPIITTCTTVTNNIATNLSQFFNATQFDEIVAQTNFIRKLNLTQMFCDDNDAAENTENTNATNTAAAAADNNKHPHQSSDLFLSQVKNLPIIENNLQLPQTILENCTIYQSKNNASAYIQLQRSMHNLNEDNLNDDNFLDADLSQAYKSTQYRREVLAEFDECEKTICNNNMDSMNGIDELMQPPPPPSLVAAEATTKTNEKQMYAVITDAADLGDMNNINWTLDFENMSMKLPDGGGGVDVSSPARLKPPSSSSAIVRQRLGELSAKKENLNKFSPARLRPASTFCSMGTFYGLPAKVRKLIKDFKGITELYGG